MATDEMGNTSEPSETPWPTPSEIAGPGETAPPGKPSSARSGSSRHEHEAEPLSPLVKDWERGKEALRRAVRVKTTWPRTERLLSPCSERFWVIGGRPGNFKTQTMWNLAMDLAHRRQRVLFVSLEQAGSELALQAISRFSRVPLDRVAAAHSPDTGVNLTDAELAAIEDAETRLVETEMYLRLHSADQHGRALGDVIRSATRSRFDAIFVDHVGMIGRGSGGSDIATLPLSVDGMRGLCRGERVKGYRPFVCVTSPLNRDIDRDTDGDEVRVPRLSDFRGSGLIESDADVAMILQKRKRATYDEANTDPDVVDAFVLKNRQGRCPLVLTFEARGEICFVRERPVEPDPSPDAAPRPGNWVDGNDGY